MSRDRFRSNGDSFSACFETKLQFGVNNMERNASIIFARLVPFVKFASQARKALGAALEQIQAFDRRFVSAINFSV